MSHGTLSLDRAAPAALSERLKSALTLFAVGSVFVFGVGLANTSLAHNAAHDTRHAIGFPCH